MLDCKGTFRSFVLIEISLSFFYIEIVTISLISCSSFLNTWSGVLHCHGTDLICLLLVKMHLIPKSAEMVDFQEGL